MIDIIEWSKAFDVNRKPWLLLGKGPSFSRLAGTKTDEFLICSLNHVVRELPVDLAHMIDIDVALDCGEAIDKNARCLVMPYRPHRDFKPSDKTIEDYAREIPLLGKLAREGRLLWYNLASSPPFGGSPVIKSKFFSAEAALNILAACGAKTVRSLGVDGGASYSPEFEDLNGRTLLANGHASFDRQFEGIARTLRTTGIFYAPLHVEAPARVFVGTSPSQLLACKVLEYSIKKHGSISVSVQPIDNGGIPVPKDPKNRSRTGFSFSRFNIPALCGYRGRAAYMDADMQVFRDISGLWGIPMDGASLLYSFPHPHLARRPQYSVMLLDCVKLRWDVSALVSGLDSGAYTYEQLMYDFCVIPEADKKPAIPPEWNSLEHYEKGRTGLLHYTDMPTQPWVSRSNRNGALWYSDLREAVEENFIPLELLHEEIAKGHVAPDLARWADLPDPPGRRSTLRSWRPPFRKLGKAGIASMPFFVRRFADALRRLWLSWRR